MASSSSIPTTILTTVCILLSSLLQPTYSCDSSCEIYLQNNDFADGTYRITTSAVYCLKQDITFNPHPNPISNPNTNCAWFPVDDSNYPGCATLTGYAYSLGWFAAISIETDNIEINLCGFQISQSLQFNIQQRWFNVIEIAPAAFEKGRGPTDFGDLKGVKNIYIHNGDLGLSSHNSIHSNSAQNVRLENMRMFDFEVAGIQFNGARNIIIKNIEIGPSNDNLKPTAYYSNARFVALAMRLLLDKITYNPSKKYITFAGHRKLSLQKIYNDLITSMDIGFRYFLNANTEQDKSHDLYPISLDLYHNKFGLPDGSALYGILLNSYSWAIFGLGQERNNAGDGEQILIENVRISNLKLSTNEFPNIYFDECSDKNSQTQTFIKGPFGDTMDIRKMVHRKYRNVIDNGGDITQLKYEGNPLDDARIALALLGPEYDLQFGSVRLDNTHFFGWALDTYESVSYETLPLCAAFVCNSDVMFHNSKGVIGFRADLIDDLEVKGIKIRKIVNRTPLNSFACGAYDGPNDGGHPTQAQGYGGLSTSVKGMCIFGGDLLMHGSGNRIVNLKSNNGDVTGMHILGDAIVIFEDGLEINNVQTCKNLDNSDINALVKEGKYPYPNDCFVCNILLDPIEDNGRYIQPNPPNGIDGLYCHDINGKDKILPIPRTKYEPKKEKLIYYDRKDKRYRNLNWDPKYKCEKN